MIALHIGLAVYFTFMLGLLLWDEISSDPRMYGPSWIDRLWRKLWRQ